MNYYQYHVFFCTNQRENGETCCGNHAAQALRDYAKDRMKALKLNGSGKIRVNSAGCMGRCAAGPALVVYPDGIWYTYGDQSDVEEIIQEHLCHGRVVERLRI